jgi:hypothetical protein
MIMQASFTRCGQPIPMRVEKFDYLFTENQYGDFVASIVSEDHVKHLLDTGNFKEYVPPTMEEWKAREKEAAKDKAKSDAAKGKANKE